MEYKDMISIWDYPGTFGAAIGDVIGSMYEFEYGRKDSKDQVRFFREGSTYTDDTVLTCAVADYLRAEEEAKAKDFLVSWARNYPFAGYGARFLEFIHSPDPQPYGSFGNGSAMRVSPVAYYAKSEEDVIRLSDEVTAPTHNHPEGMKGARVIAMCIYKALHGASRKEIADYAQAYYDLAHCSYDEWKRFPGHGDEICQVTVPQALWIFLHSDSFEDCLRLCMAIRWDADTLAAIACPIAEAYYKEIPAFLLEGVQAKLDARILEALRSVPKKI